MRNALIGSATAMLLLFSTAAPADPPMGVGAAITASGFECLVTVVVEPGDNITPALPDGYGALLTPLVENTKWVQANSANGNVNLTCHGRIEYGGPIIGFDPVHGLVEGTVPPLDVACEVLNAGGFDVCNAEGAIVVSFENSGLTCEPTPGLVTLDWKQIVTPGGTIVLSCQYVAE